jgi:hypothetical protein
MPPCGRSRCVRNIDRRKRSQHGSHATGSRWSAEPIATFGETGMAGSLHAAVKNSVAGERRSAGFFRKKTIAPIRRLLDGAVSQP